MTRRVDNILISRRVTEASCYVQEQRHMVRKVSFNGVTSPGKDVSFRTWPRSGLRKNTTSLDARFDSERGDAGVAQVPIKEKIPVEVNRDLLDTSLETPESCAAVISGIFYGSVDIQTVQPHEKLFENALERIGSDQESQNGSAELWMVVNMLLRSLISTVQSESAALLMTLARRDIERHEESSTTDVLKSRLLVQIIRSVDVILSSPRLVQQLETSLSQWWLRRCIRILSQPFSSKALVGASMHLIKNHAALSTSLEDDDIYTLGRAIVMQRPWSSGTLAIEIMAMISMLIREFRSQMSQSAGQWIPSVLRSAAGPHMGARSQALTVLAAILYIDESTGNFESQENWLCEQSISNAVIASVDSDASGEYMTRRTLELLTNQASVEDGVMLWERMLLLAGARSIEATYSTVQSSSASESLAPWRHLGKWVETGKTALQISWARTLMIRAWRSVALVSTVGAASTTLTCRNGLQGILYPFKLVRTAPISEFSAYTGLLTSFIYVSRRVEPNVPVDIAWDSMLAPVMRLFFENSDPMARKQSVAYFGNLLDSAEAARDSMVREGFRNLSACFGPGTQAAREQAEADAEMRAKVKASRLRLLQSPVLMSEAGGLPLDWSCEQLGSKLLIFVQTIIEDCKLQDQEIVGVWTSLVGVVRRALASEMQESEASLGRIALLTAFVQTNKAIARLSPELAAIMIERLGARSLSPMRLKLRQLQRGSPMTVSLADRGSGTTSALTTLVGIILRGRGVVPDALRTILGYGRNASAAVAIIHALFLAVAEFGTETNWDTCAEMLEMLMDSPTHAHIFEDDPSTVQNALTAALALEKLPTSANVWQRWARLFGGLAVESSSETDEYLNNILDRVPGEGGAPLVALKATVLKGNDAFDAALTRIGVDAARLAPTSLLEVVVKPHAAELPVSFKKELARHIFSHTSSLSTSPESADSAVSVAMSLLEPALIAENADALLRALTNSPMSIKPVYISAWNSSFGKGVFGSLPEEARKLFEQSRHSHPDLMDPVILPDSCDNYDDENRYNLASDEDFQGSTLDDTPPKLMRRYGSGSRSLRSAASPTLKRRDESPQSTSPTKRQRYSRSPQLIPTLRTSSLASPPPSDQDIDHLVAGTGTTIAREELPSSPSPIPPHAAESEKLRTLKRSLIGLNVFSAVQGFDRAECELIHNLMRDVAGDLKVCLKNWSLQHE